MISDGNPLGKQVGEGMCWVLQEGAQTVNLEATITNISRVTPPMLPFVAGAGILFCAYQIFKDRSQQPNADIEQPAIQSSATKYSPK